MVNRALQLACMEAEAKSRLSRRLVTLRKSSSRCHHLNSCRGRRAQVRVQHEPRAAHAAQLHHRLQHAPDGVSPLSRAQGEWSPPRPHGSRRCKEFCSRNGGHQARFTAPPYPTMSAATLGISRLRSKADAATPAGVFAHVAVVGRGSSPHHHAGTGRRAHA